MIKILILSSLMLLNGWAHEVSLDKRNILVYGTSLIQVKPDKMNWFLAVETKKSKLPTTASEHLKTVAKVISFLKDNQIEEKDIQTTAIQLTENWAYTKKGRVKKGYIASTNISFSIYEFDKYVNLWLGLAKIKGINVRWTQYDVVERIKYQNNMRESALLVAKQKAAKLVKILDQKLGHVLLIEEINQGSYDTKSNRNKAFDDSESKMITSGEALAPGQINIKSKVKAIFLIK